MYSFMRYFSKLEHKIQSKQTSASMHTHTQHTHTHTHARTHARTHTRTHARTHTHTHVRTHPHHHPTPTTHLHPHTHGRNGFIHYSSLRTCIQYSASAGHIDRHIVYDKVINLYAVVLYDMMVLFRHLNICRHLTHTHTHVYILYTI